jgi:hypothetical protein
MLGLMSKPLGELDRGDIDQLIGVAENQYIDFKVTLPSKDTAGDSWGEHVKPWEMLRPRQPPPGAGRCWRPWPGTIG